MAIRKQSPLEGSIRLNENQRSSQEWCNRPCHCHVEALSGGEGRLPVRNVTTSVRWRKAIYKALVLHQDTFICNLVSFFPFQEQKLKCNIRNPNSQFKPMTKLAIALKPGFRFSPWCAQPWLAPLCLHLVSQLSYLLASSPTTLQPQELFSSLDTSNTPLLLNRCLWCAFCCEHSLPCWFLISWKNPSYMERLSLTTLDMVSSSFLTMAAFLFLSEHLPQFVNDLSSLPSASLIRLWALERRKSYVLLLTLSWCHWTRQMLMMTELNKWTMNKGIIADQ